MAANSIVFTSREDRIFDVYDGHVGNAQTRQALLERLGWILARVHDGPVLDIGCSQGLLPILLGRQGFQTCGVDIEPSAIATAKAKLALEPQEVQRNVRFELTDAMALPAGDYSVLVVAEVLEHLQEPERFLEHILRHVRQEGVALVQVPFGVHPHPDHFTTFYAGSLAAMVRPPWSIVHVEVVGWRLCAELRRRMPGLSAAELLALDEKEFEKKERAYTEKINRLSNAYAHYQRRARQLTGYEQRYVLLRHSLPRPWAWPDLVRQMVLPKIRRRRS